MIKTKKDIIKLLLKVSELKIKQGLFLKDLAHSLEYHYRNRPFKEWKDIINSKKEFSDILNKEVKP